MLLYDNGATKAGGPNGSPSLEGALAGIPSTMDELLPRIDEIGGPKMEALYPRGWAMVGNTPFQEYKANVFAGGTRTPLIIHWPRGIRAKGEIRSQYVHVSDITPTVLDILQINPPATYQGIEQMPMHGISARYTFADATAPAKRTTQYYSLGGRSIYQDGWKAIAVHKNGQPFEKDTWELYNVNADYAEAHDLATHNPEKLKELQELWRTEARKYGALPLHEDALTPMYVPPDSVIARSTFKYFPHMGNLGPQATPELRDRSYTITVPVTRNSRSDEGVLVGFGDHGSGYTLFVMNNHLVYEYNLHSKALYRMESTAEVPTGASTLKLQFTKTGPYAGVGRLFIDDKVAGEVAMPKTTTVFLTMDGMGIGRDPYLPVSKSYEDKGEFPFTGEIQSVAFELQDDQGKGATAGSDKMQSFTLERVN